jgi:hypothetical protein
MVNQRLKQRLKRDPFRPILKMNPFLPGALGPFSMNENAARTHQLGIWSVNVYG